MTRLSPEGKAAFEREASALRKFLQSKHEGVASLPRLLAAEVIEVDDEQMGCICTATQVQPVTGDICSTYGVLPYTFCVVWHLLFSFTTSCIFSGLSSVLKEQV